MAELYFLRHGRRVDDARKTDSGARALYEGFEEWDPSLASSAVEQVSEVAAEIAGSSGAFVGGKTEGVQRKNVFIHFSPYLRCCQTADLLVSELKARWTEMHPEFKIRYQLLGDFALSDWIHEDSKHQPPFVDSNEAYQMYTPNIKLLKNRSCCSNFRPTVTLGPYNGPGLSYDDYRANCKRYFQNLVHSYDKPSYIRNRDIIIIVSHGYAVANFLSFFLNRSVFDEIPETKINYAKTVLKQDQEDTEEDKYNPARYDWKLLKDALGLLEKEEDLDGVLDLKSDVHYYQSTFFHKEEFNNRNLPHLGPQDQPRPSFRLSRSDGLKEEPKIKNIVKNYNPICPAAKDWTPQGSRFQIKADFRLKNINDEAFKKSFSLSHHPSRPISPEVSPNSEPTRSNSVIDLSKLVDNNDIYKPMKLKYSTTSEIPIHQLNSKVNSQVNLAQFQRSNQSSGDNSLVDLPRYLTSLQPNRRRSTSNPIYATVQHNAKDSYFPSNIVHVSNSSAKKSSDQLYHTSSAPDNERSSDSISKNLDIIEEQGDTSRKSSQNYNDLLLNRSKSLNYKRMVSDKGSTLLLSKLQKKNSQNDDENSYDSKKFSLDFHNRQNKPEGSGADQWKEKTSSTTILPAAAHDRRRGHSVKFMPSSQNTARNDDLPDQSKMTSKSFSEWSKGTRSLFDNFDSEESGDISISSEDSSSSDSDSASDDQASESGANPSKTKPRGKKPREQYIWFGQNRK
ncbi:Piso0_001658 [Millerozyma farinosa CBS 7064]|uniref:Piso0_001658 protein n=1 Tax=Pichia sorbitophila (strain ATCC MYA-4447 / BCRC 22081 / CBS 7064 / NBRC 10061 / NRRL Y-12695) TaxID=559304 RepID=G8YLD4_PICSO|nr:Piso0_001658 [Millerozyma farinosa CBS 7064]